MVRRLCYVLACLVVLGSLLLPPAAYAAPPDVDREAMKSRINEVRRQSEDDKEGKTEKERREINRKETQQIKAIRDEYGEDNENSDSGDGIPGRGGQVNIQGLFPVTFFDLGQPVGLTFHWIDLASGVTIPGPAIGSVLYEVNLDPFDEFNFVPIGIGTDLASDFLVPFTIVDFEPFIRGTPFDAAGAPIVISGLNDFNVAVGFVTNVGPVPEPGSLLLLSGGVVACAAFAARRRFTLPSRP